MLPSVVVAVLKGTTKAAATYVKGQGLDNLPTVAHCPPALSHLYMSHSSGPREQSHCVVLPEAALVALSCGS